MATLQVEARRLFELRQEKQKAEKELDKIKKRHAAQEKAVMDRLHDEKSPGAKFDLGEPYGVVEFQPRKKIFSRVFNRQELIESLKKSGRLEECTREDFRKAELNALVRECLNTGEKLPPGLDFSETPYVQITQKKGG